MQVSPISMNNVQPQKKLNFKATLSPNLSVTLAIQAQKKGSKALEALKNKIAEVKTWGSANAEIQKVQSELSSKASALALNLKELPAYFDTRLKSK